MSRKQPRWTKKGSAWQVSEAARNRNKVITAMLRKEGILLWAESLSGIFKGKNANPKGLLLLKNEPLCLWTFWSFARVRCLSTFRKNSRWCQQPTAMWSNFAIGFREADESSDFRAFVDDCRVATETFVFASEEAAFYASEQTSRILRARTPKAGCPGRELVVVGRRSRNLVPDWQKRHRATILMSISSSEFWLQRRLCDSRTIVQNVSARDRRVAGTWMYVYVRVYPRKNSKRIRDARQGKHPSFNKCFAIWMGFFIATIITLWKS